MTRSAPKPCRSQRRSAAPPRRAGRPATVALLLTSVLAAQTAGDAATVWPRVLDGRPFSTTPTALALSPDGASLATLGREGRLAFGPVGAAPTWFAECDGKAYGPIAFSPDGAYVHVPTLADDGLRRRVFATRDGRRVDEPPKELDDVRDEAIGAVLHDGRFTVVRDADGGYRVSPDPNGRGVLRAVGPAPDDPPFRRASLAGGRLALPVAEGVAVYDLGGGDPPRLVADRHGLDFFGATWNADVLLLRGPGAARRATCGAPSPALERCRGDAVWAGGFLCDFGAIPGFPAEAVTGVAGAAAAPIAAARVAGVGLWIAVGPEFAARNLLADYSPSLPFALSADGTRIVRQRHPSNPLGEPYLEAGDTRTGCRVWNTDVQGDGFRELRFAPVGGVFACVMDDNRTPDQVAVRFDSLGSIVGRRRAAPFGIGRPECAGAFAFDADGSHMLSTDGREVSIAVLASAVAPTTHPLPPPREESGGARRAAVVAAPRGDGYLVAQFDTVGPDTRRADRNVVAGSLFARPPNVGRIFLGSVRGGVRADRSFPAAARHVEIPMTFVGPDAFAVFDGKDVVVRAVDELRTLTVLPGPADFLRGSPDGRFLAVVDRGELRVYRRP